ncbi:hybrid sensor histidine kinase/response regulator [Polaribacter reichenbachii]|uniref:histidine kinase n=1 Tax=Polaribacter reichenbachii TaxID=996801 RepID=A0A1B8U1Q0_9FLAO|nr:hybrid sensor histidine kinase/response regulator transcription factor [Polaribacter reichenbachii]APZ47324.1 hybrid sensor histidine kinase/response regulator [Polaribacter reichenbachii]AUC17965.1 hybrid sensor histidine kinase/response regulator [Polaribacter reichenbachii]OBY65709.1 hybrid sensor histidine kinase/response regulator [Polaribacter reichenbachii]
MKKYIALIICFIPFFVGNAQNLKFEHYNDTDGLSHNSVRHIVQDKHGFLWLGTFSGLNRFDGYQFKSYLSSSLDNNELLNDDITDLELDEASNNLWIGTRKGLTLFKTDTRTFSTFLPEKDNPNSLTDEEIRSVHVDKFKRVWVGTKTAGVFLFYPEENRFEKIDLPGFEYIKEIFEDKKGNIWIGSFGSGSIARISLDTKGGISELVTYSLNIPNSNDKNPYVNFIYEDANSSIFVGTRVGLYKLDSETNTFSNLYIESKTVRENLGPYFLSVARAPDGKYWVGTLGGLLVCNQLEDISKGYFQWHYSILSDDTSLVDNLISALYFDASGVLWIGTEDGLDKYDPYENQFNLNKDISLYIDNQAPRVRGFSKTFDDNVIVATWHNGLFISEDKNFSPLHNTKYNIASIYSTDGKIFYCGLWSGKILVYNYIKNSSKVVNIGFVNNPIFTFVKYDETTIIAGAYGGAKVLDAKTLQPKKTHGLLLPNFNINKIIKNNNNLWFATEAGLLKYNFITKITKQYSHEPNNKFTLPHENVSDVFIDENNNLWAATRKGLALYSSDKDNFKTISELKEYEGKWITNITADNTGDLWLNMNNNTIVKYSVSAKTVNAYHVNSGNRLDVFSSSGFYNFNNTHIYVAGKEGVIWFSPYTIKENKYSPKPIITEFKVQNKEVFPGDNINGQVPFTKDLNFGKEATLDYMNRNFSIQFSTPSYTNERLNKFQYMLEGFDKQWIDTNNESRTVQYTNLYANDYVFKVRSSNSDGNWSEVSSYKIKVLQTFWLTYKGISIIILLLIFLVYFLRKQIKIRFNLKQELLLEKVKRERDEKLNNEKLRFFTNISHELRTPLTLILGPVKQLLDQEGINAYTRSRGDLINQNANRLLRLVNQILDFRRAETGELKLKISKVDILTGTKNIFNSFIELSQTKNINFNINIEEKNLECWIDMDKYNKILYNLLSNAMKFTNNYGNVDLFIGFKGKKNKKLIIEVSDDGIGIPLESQEKIFTRFYQAQNSKDNTTGTGIGLSFVKALINIHKGKIKVQSTPNEGSIFTVELPVFLGAFSDDDIFNFTVSKANEEKLVSINQVAQSYTNIKVKKAKTNVDIKHKILVIEDNPELRKYVVEYLSDFYKVYEAENGKEGLEVCRKIKPALCVADVMMPVMDGFHFVEELKTDENISHIAVILLTALAENENRIKGYEIGVDGYLVKPFDPALLKTRIDNIIKIHFDLKQKFSGDPESDVISLAHSQIDIDLISKIKDIIETNISNPELTSSYLCKELGMSSSKFYRKITQLTDMSPNEFIRTIRLKKSAKLLKTKNYNVSEVANMVGFNDPLYFSRCFKKQFGHAPSTLIK